MTEPSQARYVQAGLIYFALGSAILAITVFTPELASPERRQDIVHLLVGLPFFALFAALIAWGDRLLGRWLREKITMLLTLSALGRTFVFAANGVGWQPGIDWRSFAFTIEPADPAPRMLINAALMAIILTFLARASWVPFLRRLRRRDA